MAQQYITFSLNNRGYKRAILINEPPETIVTQIENIVSGNVAPAGPTEACRMAFECPVCFEQYSNDIRPTTLPCGHSLCMNDAQQLDRCPTCQVPFVFANQTMSISLRDASLACAPSHAGGRRRRSTKKHRRSTKRGCRTIKSRRRSSRSRRHR